MSSRSLRRPLSLLAAAAILAAGMLTGPLSPASAEGSKDDKIAERAEVDQQLEDLRIELNDVNDDLADTYLALAETELLIPQAQQDQVAQLLRDAGAPERRPFRRDPADERPFERAFRRAMGPRGGVRRDGADTRPAPPAAVQESLF